MRGFKIIFIFLIFSFFVLSLFLLSFKEKFILKNKIVVTIFPFYDIVKEIAGEKMEVVLLISSGAEIHDYELKTYDLLKVIGSKAIFFSGTSIDENWLNLLKNNYKNIKVVSLNKDLPLVIQEDNEIDPHYWLSLENLKKVAQNIKEALIEIDPNNQFYYEENFKNLKEKIDKIKKQAEEELKDIKNSYFVTQHNAFQYLASEMGLKNFYLESEHKEISPQDLKNILDKIKIYNIKVIFQEPGEKSYFLENIAQTLNLKIETLDPLEGKGYQNFFEGYLENIKTLKESLK